MMKKLVSVVLPVFNANPNYLQKSVQSILSQTYADIEVIVVFDRYNSKVDKAAIRVLERFTDDHRLRLIVNKRRLGFVNSLNKGIQLGKGAYIARMDCDDISSSTRIEEELDMLYRERLDLVGCWASVIDNDDKIIGALSPPHNESLIRKYLLFHNPFLHPTILFRRKMVDDTGLYNSKYEPSEDYEFYLRAFSKGVKGANLPKYLHFLREHQSSMIRGARWKENRIAYLKCKLLAVFKYGFNKPRDVFYFGITPLSFLIKPSKVLFTKKLAGLYKPNV